MAAPAAEFAEHLVTVEKQCFPMAAATTEGDRRFALPAALQLVGRVEGKPRS